MTQEKIKWGCNIKAQQEADEAYNKLKPKIKKSKKNNRKNKISGRSQTNWRGKYKEYLKSKQWLIKRKSAIKYYKGRCCRCGSKYRLEVHHLNYSRLGNEKMSDLLLLCADCHRIEHEDNPQVITTDYMSEQFRDIIKY